MKDRILNCIRESKVRESILNSQEIMSNIQNIVDHSVDVFKRGGKILLCETENDALMSTTELNGQFYKERKPLFNEKLTCKYIFCIGCNDYGYDNIYSRMVEAGKNQIF